jgi:hypothetical protein
MSSATSTDVAVKAADRGDVKSKSDATFKASHFFLLASLMAATGAVIMSRESSPEHLILVSVTIATAGLAAAGFYRMLAPLVNDTTQAASEPLSERARAVLEREKALALRAIKELEFDKSMGKLSQADFDEMAGRLRARALSLMKQLADDGSGYRAMIERELAARMSARPADRPQEAPPASPELCGCGSENDHDAIFCKRCGVKLTATSQ